LIGVALADVAIAEPAIAQPTAATGASSSPVFPPPSFPIAHASNAVFAELLGNGLLYSINYERFIWPIPIGIRAGASFFTYAVSDVSGSGNLTLLTFPITASYYWGTLRHKLQLGLGATILYTSASTDSTGTSYGSSGIAVAATAIVGYRYLPVGRGFTFGAGFTPLLRASRGFLPWGGLNAGYVF
jgi:hypothetical protein